MRYNSRVSFIKSEERRYDPVEGKNRVVTDVSQPIPCHTSDLGIDRIQAVFGASKRDVKIVRLQQGVDYNPVGAILNGVRYDVDNQRLHNTVFYLVGDENG